MLRKDVRQALRFMNPEMKELLMRLFKELKQLKLRLIIIKLKRFKVKDAINSNRELFTCTENYFDW